ncbi:MAG TPA: POTRA domain-containing protein, partial [Planctomycetota bacterium]|nr:POTRA domain-containing protein [Planctomycetota bacterium]
MQRALILAGCLLAVSALATNVRSLTAGDELPGAEPDRIERIEFKGLVTVPESRLRMLLQTHEGDVYDEATIRADKKRLQSLNIFNEAKPFKIIETVAGVKRLVLQYQCEEFPLIEGIEFVRMISETDADGAPIGEAHPDPIGPHELVMSQQKLWDAIRSRMVAPDLTPDGNRERRLALFNAISLEARAAWQAAKDRGGDSQGMPVFRYRTLGLDAYLSTEANPDAPPQEKGPGLSIRDGAFDKAATREPELNEGQRGMDTIGRLFLGRVNVDALEIEKQYAQDGYQHVRVKYKVTPVANGPDGKPLLVHLAFEIYESDRIYPAEVVFSGTTVLPDAALLSAIHSRPMLFIPPIFMEDRAQPVQTEALKADKHDVETFIRRQGYMNAEVGDPQITVDRSLPPRRGLGLHANWYEARLTFPIHKAGEYDRHFTGRIKIVGNNAVSTEEIRDVMLIRPLGPYSQELQDDDEKAIEELYQSRGRLATVAKIEEIPIAPSDPRVAEAIEKHLAVAVTNTGTNLHDLVVHISEGPEVSVGQVFVKGNTVTRDDVVYRELRLTPGMRYNSRLKDASQRALENTQLFSRVIIRPIPTANNDPLVRDLEVTVIEAQTTGSLVLGFGFSSAERFFANLTFDQKNFDASDFPQSWRDLRLRTPFIRSLKGAGQDLNVQLQIGGRSSSANITFTEPWFTGRPIDFSTNLAITRTNQINYQEEEARFALGLGRRYGDLNIFSFNGRYSIEQITITNIDNDAP